MRKITTQPEEPHPDSTSRARRPQARKLREQPTGSAADDAHPQDEEADLKDALAEPLALGDLAAGTHAGAPAAVPEREEAPHLDGGQGHVVEEQAGHDPAPAVAGPAVRVAQPVVHEHEADAERDVLGGKVRDRLGGEEVGQRGEED